MFVLMRMSIMVRHTQGRIQEFALGGVPSPFLPSPPTPLPLLSPSFPLPPFLFPLPSPPIRSRSPLNQLGSPGKLPQQGPGRSPGQKRIWCTLKLQESHWWQSFLQGVSIALLCKPCTSYDRHLSVRPYVRLSVRLSVSPSVTRWH